MLRELTVVNKRDGLLVGGVRWSGRPSQDEWTKSKDKVNWRIKCELVVLVGGVWSGSRHCPHISKSFLLLSPFYL